MVSLTTSGIWLLMKKPTTTILFWYILENLSGIGLFSFHAELKIQTFFKTFRPCNCAACPRIASGLSESAENNLFRYVSIFLFQFFKDNHKQMPFFLMQFEVYHILENFLVIWFLMQNQLRQRTSLGAKFGPYSKTAIVRQVKNSVVIICFLFFPSNLQ